MPLLQSDGECGSGTMGLSHGMEELNPKQSNRWLFRIPDVSADESAFALPPRKGARPGISLREMEFHHLTETIYYPLKAEWKTFSLVLYDVRCRRNAVFEWLQRTYDTTRDGLSFGFATSLIIPQCDLELYSGCGDVLERWVYEGVSPSAIDWGTLDMGSAEIVTCDLTIRYQRARLA